MRNSVIEIHLLYAFTSALPSLTHLVVGNIRPTVSAIYPYPPELGDPHLVSVILDVGPMYWNAFKNILAWLKLTASTRTLRSLCVTVQPPEVADFSVYLEEHGSLLEELLVDIRANTEQDCDGTWAPQSTAACY